MTGCRLLFNSVSIVVGGGGGSICVGVCIGLMETGLCNSILTVTILAVLIIQLSVTVNSPALDPPLTDMSR